jgi:hypothetical protein
MQFEENDHGDLFIGFSVGELGEGSYVQLFPNGECDGETGRWLSPEEIEETGYPVSEDDPADENGYVFIVQPCDGQPVCEIDGEQLCREHRDFRLQFKREQDALKRKQGERP